MVVAIILVILIVLLIVTEFEFDLEDGEKPSSEMVEKIADWNVGAVPNSEWWEMGTCVAIAQMWLNYKVNDANAWFEQVTDKQGTERYGAISSKKYPHPWREPNGASHDWDFVTTYIIRAYFQFKDSGKLSSNARANMKSVLAFRAGTPSVLYSENHNIMIVSAGYFGNVITGGSNTANVNWLSDFLNTKLKRHYWELNSPSYIGAEFRCLWNLYDFAPHETLKKKAKAVLDMLLAEQAVIHCNGVRGGPFFRYYGNAITDQSLDYHYSISHVYFGTPANYVSTSFLKIFAWFSDYSVPKIILDIAHASKSPFVLKSRRDLGATYYYVTAHSVLATYQGDFPDDQQNHDNTGLGGHLWDLSFDTSPRKLIFSGNKIGDYKYSESDAVQKGNVLITSHSTTINYVGVSKVFEGGWTFVQEGRTFVAIKTLSNSRVLLEVRDADDYKKSFSQFKADIKDNYLSVSGTSVTYENTFGQTIKSPARYSIEGDSFSYKLFDSPYLKSSWGSGVITVMYRGRTYTIGGF